MVSEAAPDPFRVNEIASIQSGLLAYLEPDPADITLKIAALRAAADLLSNATATAVLNTQLASLITRR